MLPVVMAGSKKNEEGERGVRFPWIGIWVSRGSRTAALLHEGRRCRGALFVWSAISVGDHLADLFEVRDVPPPLPPSAPDEIGDP